MIHILNVPEHQMFRVREDMREYNAHRPPDSKGH